MPTRVLQHGFAPTAENYGLEAGKWQDVAVHAQFLMDLEFLTRYTNPTGASCIYWRSPPYLREIASQFPWVHFYSYQHPEPEQHTNEEGGVEYNPERPQMAPNTPLVEGNMTSTAIELTNNIARRLGENGGNTSSRVMICHGADHDRQLCLHALIKPTHSLLDIQGLIPPDYYEGEIVLPMFIPNHKIFACLVVSQNARCRFYDPRLYQDEIGTPLTRFTQKSLLRQGK
jgi:hypothetical protein